MHYTKGSSIGMPKHVFSTGSTPITQRADLSVSSLSSETIPWDQCTMVLPHAAIRSSGALLRWITGGFTGEQSGVPSPSIARQTSLLVARAGSFIHLEVDFGPQISSLTIRFFVGRGRVRERSFPPGWQKPPAGGMPKACRRPVASAGRAKCVPRRGHSYSAVPPAPGY